LKSIITLTTDFGSQDGYIGAVKGVILSINPKAEIVDISHQIPAHNVLAGAFCLLNSGTFFPEGTIHVAVVDPGVGGKRKGILIQTERYFLIGPDNGIFSLLLRTENVKRIINLANPKYFLGKFSATFQGRDIFAPVAAYLSLGVEPDEFGPTLPEIARLSLPSIEKRRGKIIGRIIHVDNFGNLVSNVTAQELSKIKNFKIKIKNRIISRLSKTYSEVGKGKILAHQGSSGFLEIGIREGNARLKLDAKIGDQIEIKI
jgi:S-adenosyl-L-methionine hydrolase (adenosine-forming)